MNDVASPCKYAICGTHLGSWCHCPPETRDAMLRRRIVRPGSGVSVIPWLDQPTLRLQPPS